MEERNTFLDVGGLMINGTKWNANLVCHGQNQQIKISTNWLNEFHVLCNWKCKSLNRLKDKFETIIVK
jgi:hypothetical protein